MNSTDEMATERGSRARDHQANERTYLAWLRASANVMIVGLAVAKFIESGHPWALVAGLMLVVVGAVGIVQGMLRYRRINRQLEAGRFVTGSAGRGPLWAGGIVLAALAAAALLVLL